MTPERPLNDLDNPNLDADDRALDALLGEMLKLTPPPPDLSSEILKSLSTQWQVAALPTSTNPRNGSRVRQSSNELGDVKKSRRSRALAVSLIAALAASVLFVVSRLDHAADKNVAQNTTPLPSSPVTVSKPITTEPATKPAIATPAETTTPDAALATNAPREGVPLVRNEPTTVDSSDATEAMTPTETRDALVTANLPAVNLLAALTKFDSTIANYWKRVGVEPTAAVDAQQFASRVRNRLGSGFTVNAGDALVDSVLSTEDECRVFSTKLVASLFRNAPLAPEAREKMIEQATLVIQSGRPFDQLVSQWIVDDSLFLRSQPDQLAQSVATNLLDIDAACAKCHDSPMDGRFAQHDYWSFASVFAPKGQSILFYELPDGRQKASEPHLPTRWMGVTQEKENSLAATAPTLDVFAKALVGNQTLASAITNRIWEIAFDAPLVARSGALVSPPRDEALQEAHQQLTDLLVKSRFDLRSIARIIISSNAMKRSSGELFESDRWLVANEQTLAAGMFAQRTFAAARPSFARLNRDQLIVALESRMGGALRAIDNPGTLLAQPNVSDSGAGQASKSDKSSPEELAWARWIADRGALKESWLYWIKDLSERERHAFYANGYMNASSASDLRKRLVSPTDDAAAAIDNSIDRLAWLLGQGG